MNTLGLRVCPKAGQINNTRLRIVPIKADQNGK